MSPINEQARARITGISKKYGLSPEEAIDQAVDLWLFLAQNSLIGKDITFTHYTVDTTASFGRRVLQSVADHGVPISGVKGQIHLPSGVEADHTLRANIAPFRGSSRNPLG